MDSKERKRTLLAMLGLILLMILLSYGPWLIAWVKTPERHVYTGFLSGGTDYWSYMSKIRQGFEGSWLWENRMAPGDTALRFVFPFYLGLGRLAKVLGLPDPGGLQAVFFGASLVLMIVALVALWHWAGRMAGPRFRKLAVLLALTLSSPGILLPGMMRPDMYPAVRLYMSVYFPHYWVDIIGLTVSQTFLLDYVKMPDWRRILGGMVGVLAVSLVHPHVAAAGLVAMALYSVTSPKPERLRGLVYVLLAGLAALPYTAYLGYLLMTDVGFQEWRSQAVGLVLPLWRQVFWFGAGIPLALFGAWKARNSPPVRMALIWLAVAAVLVNAKIINGASEFAIGLSIPVGLLAAMGIGEMPKVLRVPALAVSATGWGLVTAASFALALNPGSGAHVSPERLAVMRQAVAEAAGTPILAPPSIAGQLLWAAGGRVEYGHPVETPDARARSQKTRRFYAGVMTREEARAFLASEGIRVVLVETGNSWSVYGEEPPWGPEAKKYGFLVPQSRGDGLEGDVIEKGDDP